MIVTTVVLTNAAQAKCFHSQCRSRMYAVTHQILNLDCVLSQMAINGTCEATPTRPQNSYPISARGLEGFNRLEPYLETYTPDAIESFYIHHPNFVACSVGDITNASNQYFMADGLVGKTIFSKPIDVLGNIYTNADVNCDNVNIDTDGKLTIDTNCELYRYVSAFSSFDTRNSDANSSIRSICGDPARSTTSQPQTLPLPHKHTPKSTKHCACHDFNTCISKVLRLPHKTESPTARSTTSQPFRQLPNAAPATQTHAQEHEALRLPRLQHLHLQSAAPATGSPTARSTTSQPFRQLPNAAPATQTHAQEHEVLRLPRLQHLHLQSAAPATRIGGPQPRARQHPSPLDSSQTLPLPHKHTPKSTKYCACHDFNTCISKVLRLPRELGVPNSALDNIPAL